MATSVSNGHTVQVKEAFTDCSWYLSGYAANIRTRSETVLSFMDNAVPQRILDVGCGDGSLSLPLLRQGSRVTYLDLSSTMLERVREQIPSCMIQHARFINKNFFDSDLDPASYDLILFVGVLAYIKDIVATFTQLRKLLHPSGTLVLEYTDASHFLSRLNFAYRDVAALFRAPKCTTFRHRQQTVETALEKTGFRRQRSYRYFYSVPLLLRYASQERVHKSIRTLFGSPGQPARQWLGSESLASYRVA